MAFASEFKRQEIADWWQSPDVFATVLLALAIDEFGTECLAWEPETIRMQLASLYGVNVPQANMDKLLALITVLTTDLVYRSVESFTHIANVLNGSQASFKLWDPVEADEAAWAVSEVYLNDPPPRETSLTSLYSEDIRRYLGVILENEGIITPPDVLEMAIFGSGVHGEDKTFADDPALYQSYYHLSQQKATDVVRYVRSHMAVLTTQLNAVPLQNRDQKTWAAFTARTQRTKKR